MQKGILTITIAIFLAVASAAQTSRVWTLDDCIIYAEEHNIDVKRQSLSIDKSRLELQERKWAFVPSLLVSSGFTASTGRVLDPTTYQFVQTDLTSNNSSSIEGNIDLFEGGKKLKALKKSKLSLRATLLEEEIVRYNLKLNVIAAYMDVLCIGEQVAIAKKSIDLIKDQCMRSQALLQAGSITESDVLQLRSQLLVAENDLSSAMRAEKMAKLSLCDLLEVQESEFLGVVESLKGGEYIAITDIESVIKNNPEYKLSELNQSLAEADYKIAKATLYPTLYLSAGYGSSWSDARKKMIQNQEGTIRYEAYPFFQQYADNASAFVSIGMKIPILTGLSAKNTAKRAEIAVKDAELATIENYKKVRKQIHQAQIDCDAARDLYYRSQAEVHYAEEVQRQMSVKYNLGTTDYLSWNTAFLEYSKAMYSVTEYKYRYLLTCEKLQTIINY